MWQLRAQHAEAQRHARGLLRVECLQGVEDGAFGRGIEQVVVVTLLLAEPLEQLGVESRLCASGPLRQQRGIADEVLQEGDPPDFFRRGRSGFARLRH